MANTADSERYERGYATLKEIDGDKGASVIHSLSDIAPRLGEYIVKSVFADIYGDDTLSFRDRELIAIVALAAIGGCEKQLQVHTEAAINVGMTPAEVVESFIQLVPYAGVPRALNAVGVARQVLQETEDA